MAILAYIFNLIDFGCTHRDSTSGFSVWLQIMSIFFVSAHLYNLISSLSIVAPLLWGFCVWSLFCYALRSALSSFAIISIWKRVIAALL